MTDISVDLNGYRVNLRVGAIVTRGADVLLCRLPDQNWWFLPGGRIKTNESSSDALQRELTEEIGAGFKVIRPVITAENFFHLDGIDFHEICTFYEVEWTTGVIRREGKSGGEIFEWMPREKFCDIVLKPEFIKDSILNPKSGFELVIHRTNARVY